MSRFYRSTRMAFPCERFPAVFGPYRSKSPIRQALEIFAVLALFAIIGVILGARG
jgi:hypothetical protein